jgi:hypothetical protein
MPKFVDVREKIVTKSKTKALKFDRPVSDFYEKSWKYSVISDLTHDVLL